MLSIHLLKLFLLISPTHLFPSAFDVFDVGYGFGLGLPLLPELFPVFLLGHELCLLVLVDPGDGLDVDLVLLEGGDAPSNDFLDSGDAEEEEGVRNLANIYIFEFEDISKLVLLIRPDVGNESLLGLLDVISIAGNNLIHPRRNKLYFGLPRTED